MDTELKPLRSVADYEQALARLGDLWGSTSGTPEGDRLEVLATLIDAYESEHYPDPAIPRASCSRDEGRPPASLKVAILAPLRSPHNVR